MTAPADGIVVGIPDIALTFPELPDPCIDRPYLLETVTGIFNKGVNVLILEGDEQIGKTTLLAQFCRHFSSNSFCYFFRTGTEVGFEPELIRYDLANQISWFLRSQRLPEDQAVSGPDLRVWIGDLVKRAHRSPQPIYFVIDGISALPSKYAFLQDTVFSLLPIGYRNFRFLISGEPASLDLRKYGSAKIKEQTLSPFTPEEALRFLSSFSLKDKTLEEILKICGNAPGKLASFHRLLSSGVDPDALVTSDLNTYPDFFDLEWNRVDYSNKLLCQALAAICFANHINSVDDLSEFLEVSKDKFVPSLEKLPFISVGVSGEVRFVHDALHRFASDKLKNYEGWVVERAVAALSKDPKSKDALKSLPGYLEKKGDLKGILEYIDVEKLVATLDTTHSLLNAIQSSDYALDISKKLEEPATASRYALYSSVLRGILNTAIRRSELELKLSCRRVSRQYMTGGG